MPFFAPEKRGEKEKKRGGGGGNSELHRYVSLLSIILYYVLPDNINIIHYITTW